MDCRITSIKSCRSGAALIDVLMGSALACLILVVLASLAIFGARSFTAMGNYVSLDQASRNALDRMSKEIRECSRLTGAATNYLMFENSDGGTLMYFYSSGARVLYRVKDWRVDQRPLLTECEYLQFSIYQRNPIMGAFDQYPTATPSTCKLVQMRWVCSRPLFGSLKNTESVQSAKVVIRKE